MESKESDNDQKPDEVELKPQGKIDEKKLSPIGSVKEISVIKTKAGLTLCYTTLGFIGLISIILIIYFFTATNSLNSLAQPLTQESLQLYKEAKSAIADDVVKISDRFLGSILLPILTLLLGYMFGSREEKENREEE